MPTALEIAQGRQIPLTQGVLMALQTKYPAFSAFDVRTTSDTRFMSLVVTGLPSSSFVNLNEGFSPSVGSLAVREFDCKLIGGQIAEDDITAKKWNAAHKSAGYTYFDLQTQLKMIADFRQIERVIFAGTVHDGKGFPGLKELCPFIAANVLAMTDAADDVDYAKSVINAGGTTSGDASSVYSVVFGELDVQLVIGNDQGSELLAMSEVIQQMLAPNPAEPTKTTLHNVAQVHAFVGLSVGGFTKLTPDQTVPTQFSARRLANVTKDSGKGVTDAKLDKLVRSHGDGIVPSRLFMSPRSGEQLAASRSATSVSLFLGAMPTAQQSQASLQAPPPQNFNGIPITYTSAIKNTDAVEA